MEDRTILELSDLAAVHLQCRECKGTTVVIAVTTFTHPPHECPTCRVPWFQSRSVEDTALQQLISHIREMPTLAARARVSVRFEVARPGSGPPSP